MFKSQEIQDISNNTWVPFHLGQDDDCHQRGEGAKHAATLSHGAKVAEDAEAETEDAEEDEGRPAVGMPRRRNAQLEELKEKDVWLRKVDVDAGADEKGAGDGALEEQSLLEIPVVHDGAVRWWLERASPSIGPN